MATFTAKKDFRLTFFDCIALDDAPLFKAFFCVSNFIPQDENTYVHRKYGAAEEGRPFTITNNSNPTRFTKKQSNRYLLFAIVFFRSNANARGKAPYRISVTIMEAIKDEACTANLCGDTA